MKYKKSIVALVCLLYILIFSGHIKAQVVNPSPEQQPRPATGLQRPVVQNSPEILPDNRVTFRLLAPTANDVSVAGVWMEKQFKVSEKMVKDDKGLWTLTVGPLKPEYYGYKFIIDGATMLDPNNFLIRRDWLGYESVLLMPGKETELYFTKDVPEGTLAKVWYNSPTLGFKRRMYIYTPPGYETSTEKYPVLYLLHGGMNDEDTWTSMGLVNTIMDNLIAQGKAKPMIVVMPNGNPDQAAVRFESYPLTPDPKLVGPEPMNMANGYFESSLVKDIVPFLEANYKVSANKENRAVIGYSMGGGQTYKIVLDNPDVFSYIGLFAAAARPQASDDKKFEALKAANPKLVWIGCGVEDPIDKNMKDNLIPLLEKYNINHYFLETPGGHEWANWRIFFSKCVPTLFK
jgi:enterochelin esterase-like enzyme